MALLWVSASTSRRAEPAACGLSSSQQIALVEPHKLLLWGGGDLQQPDDMGSKGGLASYSSPLAPRPVQRR